MNYFFSDKKDPERGIDSEPAINPESHLKGEAHNMDILCIELKDVISKEREFFILQAISSINLN